MSKPTSTVETVAIADLGNDIQLTYSVSGFVYTFNKLQLKMKQTDKFIFITNGDGFENSFANQVLRLDYAEVSAPTGLTSNDDLFTEIQSMVSGVSLGGSSGASGDGVYSSGSQSFTATPTVGANTVTITGYPYTFDETHVLSVTKYSSAGVKETLNMSQVTVSGGVITLVSEDNFVTGDTVKVYLEGPYRSYDQAGDQDVTFVTNQDSEKWTSPEHLVDISAQGAADLRYVIPMRGYKDLCPHWKFSNSNVGDTITMTIWSTNNADADDSADTDWVERTTDWLTKTLTVTNGTIEFMEEIENINALKVMIKLVVVSAAATNAADIYITKKAL
jgi:hypothetical protein